MQSLFNRLPSVASAAVPSSTAQSTLRDVIRDRLTAKPPRTATNVSGLAASVFLDAHRAAVRSIEEWRRIGNGPAPRSTRYTRFAVGRWTLHPDGEMTFEPFDAPIPVDATMRVFTHMHPPVTERVREWPAVGPNRFYAQESS